MSQQPRLFETDEPGSFVFPVQIARRFPDPNFRASHGMERHIFFVAARDVPKDLPYDPNARQPNTNRKIYREILDSLFNRDCIPGTFHLKHRGITLVAESVKKVRNEDVYVLTFGEGHGILDGGHSYKILTEADGEIPEQQYVKFEVFTNIPDDWIFSLSEGLNTSVQVQPWSIDNLQGLFDWIKEEIRDKPYSNNEVIAWKEGDPGQFSAKDLIGIFTLFHIGYFPNDENRHPIEGYEKKANSLKRYEKDQKGKDGEDPLNSYQKLRPLLHEILVLHDTVRKNARDLYRDAGGHFPKLKFVESRMRKPYPFPFTEESSEYRLMNGALYPILGAFRWMVEEDPDTGLYRWRGGFDAVLSLWKKLGGDLIKLTQETSQEQGRNPDAIGKSRPHWSNLHSFVTKSWLLDRFSKSM